MFKLYFHPVWNQRNISSIIPPRWERKKKIIELRRDTVTSKILTNIKHNNLGTVTKTHLLERDKKLQHKKLIYYIYHEPPPGRRVYGLGYEGPGCPNYVQGNRIYNPQNRPRRVQGIPCKMNAPNSCQRLLFVFPFRHSARNQSGRQSSLPDVWQRRRMFL